MGDGCGRRGSVQCRGWMGNTLVRGGGVKHYGGVMGGVESAVAEMRRHPGAKMRINCTCGLSQDFNGLVDAGEFMALHSIHIVAWSIDLVGVDGIVVWELEALSVESQD